MEQYFIPKELDFVNLRYCLDHYPAERLFIRDCGGYRADGKYHLEGLVKVHEDLAGKTLDFRKNRKGLTFLIDGEAVFNFPLADYERDSKGFTLAYERIGPTADGIGRLIMLSTGIDPDDPNLPEPKTSTLRHIFDRHLLEISFPGRIPLHFHSWYENPHWKYWVVVDAPEKKKIAKKRERK